MPATNRLKNQHLLWRAAFGPMAENAADLDTLSQKALWDLLLKTSFKAPEKLDVAANLFDGLSKGVQELGQMQKLSKDEKQAMRKQSRDGLKSLNIRWMDEMINSEAQFREKMSLFWHGHFACRVINIYYQQELLDVIRRNAFGNFGELLRAVSKSPSMLQFLNNQQNKKQHPNENFAREVMELFTMGRDNYTENDIKEAARSFTGWGFNLQGEFVFRQNFHDDGSKTFLGRTGQFDGDDIIDILLEQKSTALFITKKIYRFFVNDAVDEAKVATLATAFQKDYDIKKLMSAIFTSDWFYDDKNIGNKIKSPVDLLVGIRRLLPLELQNDAAQLLFQRALGQILFYPPNVAGWAGGKSWIDSSTLMLRLRIPQIITYNESINIKPKGDDDVMMGQMKDADVAAARQNKEYANKGGTAVVDWAAVTKIFESTPRENLLTKISDTVLQTTGKMNTAILSRYVDSSSRDNYIRTAVVSLMSTPEYQLC